MDVLALYQLLKFFDVVWQLAGTLLDCGLKNMIDAFTSIVYPLSTASGNNVMQGVDERTTQSYTIFLYGKNADNDLRTYETQKDYKKYFRL